MSTPVTFREPKSERSHLTHLQNRQMSGFACKQPPPDNLQHDGAQRLRAEPCSALLLGLAPEGRARLGRGLQDGLQLAMQTPTHAILPRWNHMCGWAHHGLLRIVCASTSARQFCTYAHSQMRTAFCTDDYSC